MIDTFGLAVICGLQDDLHCQVYIIQLSLLVRLQALAFGHQLIPSMSMNENRERTPVRKHFRSPLY